MEFDPTLIQRLESLELRSRYVVEGFLSGLNKSPFKGFSVEFAQYRHFMQGDPLRSIDWKLFGRSDRLYVKQYEEETNLQCHLLLDLSGSMEYQSRPELMTKMNYARTVSAALAFFIHRQRDAIGLTLLNPADNDYLPARLTPSHLRQVMAKLEGAAAEGQIDFAERVESFANLLHRRSLIIIVSDFYENAATLESALRRLRYGHHDVMAMQIVDPAEVDFEFSESSFFEDLETGTRLPIHPELVRRDYLKRFNSHMDSVRKVMRDYDVDFTQIRTDEFPAAALSAYLARREGKL